MILIDEADWPISLVRWEYPADQCDVDLYRSRFRLWLLRKSRFAVFNMVDLGTSTMRSIERMHGYGWARPLRDQIKSRCVGVAVLLTDALVTERRLHILHKACADHMECPVRCFVHNDDALRWLRQRLSAAGIEGHDGVAEI